MSPIYSHKFYTAFLFYFLIWYVSLLLELVQDSTFINIWVKLNALVCLNNGGWQPIPLIQNLLSKHVLPYMPPQTSNSSSLYLLCVMTCSDNFRALVFISLIYDWPNISLGHIKPLSCMFVASSDQDTSIGLCRKGPWYHVSALLSLYFLEPMSILYHGDQNYSVDQVGPHQCWYSFFCYWCFNYKSHNSDLLCVLMHCCFIGYKLYYFKGKN